MSALMQETEMVNEVAAVQARPAHLPPAIDSKPVAGGQITINLALTPRMLVLLASPVTVLLTMLLAWAVLTSLGQTIYPREMVGGAIVNTLGGILAAIPLALRMKQGSQAIAQSAIIGIAIRCGSILLLMAMAIAPGWGLAKMPTIYWVLTFYFPLLTVETASVAWLSHKAAH